LAQHVQDDGFHEIQLNGKQLVFLFMAATVVSVVIFLCGVLVGRGVRAERGGTIADATGLGTATAAEIEPRPASSTPPPATPAGSDPTAAAPPPAGEDLSYFNRLEKPKTPAEQLKKPSPEKAAPGPSVAIEARSRPGQGAQANQSVPTGQKPKETPPPKPANAPTAEWGYTVQVAALNVRGEADAIVRRLAGKGYAAYVLEPASGAAAVYRVRVGSFKTRHEAETIAAKLKKEEQFNPWITR
jgi:cell division septation protein DedD